MLPNLVELLQRLDEIEKALFSTTQLVQEQNEKINEIHQVFLGLATVLPGFSMGTPQPSPNGHTPPINAALLLEP